MNRKELMALQPRQTISREHLERFFEVHLDG